MNKNERLCSLPDTGKTAAEKYDIIVIGGGIAGCSAALAAARHGKRTLLVEKLTVLGGLATTGHITIYLPLDDGYGRQVIGGISEELLKLSTKYAYHGVDISTWKEEGRRYECKFNGPAFSLALEELLASEGVDILYDSLFAGSEVSDGICHGVFVENKSGRLFYKCRGVVDASGDADLFFRNGSSCIAAENSLAIWLYLTEGANVGTVQKRGGKDAPGIELTAFGTIDTKAKKHIVLKPYFGDSGDGVNTFILDSHKRLLDVMKDNPSAVPASLPGMADIRMARRIDGSYELADKDANTHFEDNIACTGDWRRPGPVYEIPYRTLFNNDLKNVLSAGRCISTSGEAWEIIRCIPQASATGQAAGTALAMALDCGVDVQDLDVMRLRETLKADGMILDVNKG
ncbi:MAG: FAD-dependent oxidoreductase [Spirochaetales bacterium]|nr:FAD-dependent oxidoreductase [Spirochaetales bacterium]